MSAKFPRGGGAGPFLARSLLAILQSTTNPSNLILVLGAQKNHLKGDIAHVNP